MYKVKYCILLWLCLGVCLYFTDVACLMEHESCHDYIACHQTSECVSPALVPDSAQPDLYALHFAAVLPTVADAELWPRPSASPISDDLISPSRHRCLAPRTGHLRRGPPVT